MLKTINLILIISMLSSCTWLGNRRLLAIQGNDFKEEQVHQLKLGMYPNDVAKIMGTPVYNNSFNPNHWEYIHTYQAGNKRRLSRRVNLTFKNGKLIKIDTFV